MSEEFDDLDVEREEAEEVAPDFDPEAPHGRGANGQPRRQPVNRDRRPGVNEALTNPGVARGAPTPSARARTELRRALVMEAMLEGLSHQQVADRLNLTRSTVTQDIRIVRNQWRQRALAPIEDLVAQEAALLDRRQQAVAPAAFQGSLDCDKQLNQIQVRRAKLLGLDKAANVDVTLKTAEDLSLESKLAWMAENVEAGRGVETGWGAGVDLRDASASPEETEDPNSDEDYGR